MRRSFYDSLSRLAPGKGSSPPTEDGLSYIEIATKRVHSAIKVRLLTERAQIIEETGGRITMNRLREEASRRVAARDSLDIANLARAIMFDDMTRGAQSMLSPE